MDPEDTQDSNLEDTIGQLRHWFHYCTAAILEFLLSR